MIEAPVLPASAQSGLPCPLRRTPQRRSAVVSAFGLIVLAMIVPAWSAENCVDSNAVQYGTEDADLLSRVQVEVVSFDSAAQKLAQSGSLATSPYGSGRLAVDAADMTKDGPWTTRLYVTTQVQKPTGVTATFRNHANGGVRATWLNEKLVWVQVWWGRIRSTDLILDATSGKWIYAEKADYLALSLPSCTDGKQERSK